MNEFIKKTGRIPGPSGSLPNVGKIAFELKVECFTDGNINIVHPDQVNIEAIATYIDVLATAIRILVNLRMKNQPQSRIVVPNMVLADEIREPERNG